MPTLPQLSVVDAKGAIDRREISCLEYVQALVDQHAKTESLNGPVAAFRHSIGHQGQHRLRGHADRRGNGSAPRRRTSS
ncbi:hypothetical protein [Burkholderia cepacia]|uniref:hypothetical protein n=1 Tax=Burkholderia cepacia TaxID=292 RepID=UPI0018C65445|nr:hypothetical protein [Burkholderia cepacia]